MVRQLSVAGPSGELLRPDLTVFRNGPAVALIELKDPADTQAGLGVAIDQLDRYLRTAPDLFGPNLALAAPDGMLTRVGSVTSGRGRFMPWRAQEGEQPTLEALIHTASTATISTTSCSTLLRPAARCCSRIRRRPKAAIT